MDIGPDPGERTNVLAQSKTSLPDFSDLEFWTPVKSCLLCGPGEFRLVREAGDRHYGNPGRFRIVECGNCGLNFLNPMPTLRYLSEAYPENYYAYAAPDMQELPALHLRRLVKQIFLYTPGRTGDPVFTAPGTMLDIGCGSGAFLTQMKDQGWNVKGVEPDERAASRGRDRGIEIFGGTLDAARFPSGHFDYIRSNHSFEHIHNPREVLQEIRRIIKSTGTLFIGVPNVDGLMAHLFGPCWWYLGAPVHTFGYSPKTLGKILSAEGFRVTAVQYNSTYSGIIGSLQIFCNRNNGKSSEDGWVIRNPALKVLSYWIARITDLLHAGDCIEIIARPV
jgi:SAM-dependent methyltransferase